MHASTSDTLPNPALGQPVKKFQDTSVRDEYIKGYQGTRRPRPHCQGRNKKGTTLFQIQDGKEGEKGKKPHKTYT